MRTDRQSPPHGSSVASHKLKTLHEMPLTSSDWTARQPHARGWLGAVSSLVRPLRRVASTLVAYPCNLIASGFAALSDATHPPSYHASIEPTEANRTAA